MQNEIEAYMHCGKCVGSKPDGTSMEDYARLSVGLTPRGIQVWCVRHDINVAYTENLSSLRANLEEEHPLMCSACEEHSHRGH